jgi:hypothetical protein
LKLGMELLAARPATLRLGTFFETWLSTPSGTVRRSLGRDEFHLGLTIDRKHRLAATGRTSICQVDLESAELGKNQAGPMVMVDADINPKTPVLAGVRTNLFLSLPAMREGVIGRLVLDGQDPVEFGFEHPQIVTTEVAPGRYVLDLTGLFC